MNHAAKAKARAVLAEAKAVAKSMEGLPTVS